MLVTARSAGGPTMDPVIVAELFALLESADVLLTDAVFEKFEPGVRLMGAETTRVKVSVLPEAILADAVSVAVLPDWARVKASDPDARTRETKVDPAGMRSVNTTPVAGFGPLLVIVIE